MIAYVVTVIAVLIASAVSDEGSDFGPRTAWFFVTLLTIGYLVSRGLAEVRQPRLVRRRQPVIPLRRRPGNTRAASPSGAKGSTMFFFFSNRLGCGTSLLISLAISALLLLVFLV
ncbi:MAG: hypothetical protein V9E82_03065 [Candidatus Nanopelagicales bacterium]